MPDIVSPAVRSRMMAGIKGKNTRPELIVRRGLHQLGFRYKLHDKKLPGKPDLVLPMYRAVIFVHGCFWHGHNCHLFRMPTTRSEFWRQKIARNKITDSAALLSLNAAGFKVLTVWECALKGKTRKSLVNVIETCAHWLGNADGDLEISGDNP